MRAAWKRGRVLWIAAILWLGLCAIARAQEETLERVEVRVSAQIGGSVYLDRGQDAFLQPGDRVRLHPIGAPEVEARVRAVSRDTCRAEIPSGATVAIGTRGEVLVPAARRPGAQVAAPAPGAPAEPVTVPPVAHPPWTHPPEEWSQDMPLLAPAQGLEPQERPSQWSGRYFLQGDATFDHEGGGREYLHPRAGVEALLENPFGQGGGLALDLEGIARSSSFDTGEDEDEQFLRLQRLSYYFGGVRGMPTRFEVGRFLHSEFPELGVLDGIELVRRTSGGDHLGASLGYLPEPTPEMETGEDAEVSVFYRFFHGPERELALGTAVQKTWHQGDEDRDLWITTLDWRPSATWYAFVTAWVDFYGSDDVIKDSGAELTELHATLGWRPSLAGGASLALTRLRWPELLRDEFTRETPAQVEDYDLQRASLSLWRDAGEHVRLSCRLDAWEDQDDDGLGGEVGIALREALWEQGELSASVFDQEGATTGVQGVRLGATRWSGANSWRLTYELANQEQEGVAGAQAELLQHAIFLAFDFAISRDWFLSLGAEQRFGDEVSATTLGFHLQRRF